MYSQAGNLYASWTSLKILSARRVTHIGVTRAVTGWLLVGKDTMHTELDDRCMCTWARGVKTDEEVQTQTKKVNKFSHQK